MMSSWQAAAWLLLGGSTLLLFLGLPVVLPVLGHATWHLYRKVVVADASPRADFRVDFFESMHGLLSSIE